MKKRGSKSDVQDAGILVDPKDPFSFATFKESEERLVSIYEIGQHFLEQREPFRVIETIRDAVLMHLQPDAACILQVDDSM